MVWYIIGAVVIASSKTKSLLVVKVVRGKIHEYTKIEIHTMFHKQFIKDTL